jgi:lactoylglutathione lyase
MAPAPLSGLFETHLAVASLDASIGFYRDVVGLELACRIDERRAAFFWIGGRGRSMLGLWEAGDGPNVMRLHLAFAATVADVLAAPARLRAAGVAPLGFHGEPSDEPVVIGWMPAVSIYFRDPDGHLLEYLAMLEEAPHAEFGVVPYSRWPRP